MFAVCAPSKPPTSAVTVENTRAGSPALATSVATRRSAACSSSRACTAGPSEASIVPPTFSYVPTASGCCRAATPGSQGAERGCAAHKALEVRTRRGQGDRAALHHHAHDALHGVSLPSEGCSSSPPHRAEHPSPRCSVHAEAALSTACSISIGSRRVSHCLTTRSRPIPVGARTSRRRRPRLMPGPDAGTLLVELQPKGERSVSLVTVLIIVVVVLLVLGLLGRGRF